MPYYDYQCNHCGNQEEKFAKIAERLTKYVDEVCNKCNTGKFDPIISGYNAFMSPEALGYKKAPADFRNFLSQVKKNNPGSLIRDH